MNEDIKVGVSLFSPLVMKTAGTYAGFEIELWEKIAAELKLKFSYAEYDFKNLLDAVKENKIDAALAGITLTEEREKVIDFSHSTFESGLRTIVSNKTKISFSALLKSIFTKEIMNILIALLVFILISAHVVWFAERNGGGTLSGPYIPSIFNALWWAIVTVATIGYGDYTPVTLLGRFFASIAILSGLAIFGLYIAQISSVITLRRLKSDISSSKDLEGKTVATREGTTSESFLRAIGALVMPVSNIEEAFRKLEHEQVQAVVFDDPVLLYYVAHEGKGKARVIGEVFNKQSYGIALKRGSDIRENINRTILQLHDSGEYNALYKKWFNTEP